MEPIRESPIAGESARGDGGSGAEAVWRFIGIAILTGVVLFLACIVVFVVDFLAEGRRERERRPRPVAEPAPATAPAEMARLLSTNGRALETALDNAYRSVREHGDAAYVFSPGQPISTSSLARVFPQVFIRGPIAGARLTLADALQGRAGLHVALRPPVVAELWVQENAIDASQPQVGACVALRQLTVASPGGVREDLSAPDAGDLCWRSGPGADPGAPRWRYVRARPP